MGTVNWRSRYIPCMKLTNSHWYNIYIYIHVHPLHSLLYRVHLTDISHLLYHFRSQTSIVYFSHLHAVHGFPVTGSSDATLDCLDQQGDLVDLVDLVSRAMFSMGIPGSDWLEVPTIYKAYFSGPNFSEYPQNSYWSEIWYLLTYLHWIGSWVIPIDVRAPQFFFQQRSVGQREPTGAPGSQGLYSLKIWWRWRRDLHRGRSGAWEIWGDGDPGNMSILKWGYVQTLSPSKMLV